MTSKLFSGRPRTTADNYNKFLQENPNVYVVDLQFKIFSETKIFILLTYAPLPPRQIGMLPIVATKKR